MFLRRSSAGWEYEPHAGRRSHLPQMVCPACGNGPYGAWMLEANPFLDVVTFTCEACGASVRLTKEMIEDGRLPPEWFPSVQAAAPPLTLTCWECGERFLATHPHAVPAEYYCGCGETV